MNNGIELHESIKDACVSSSCCCCHRTHHLRDFSLESADNGLKLLREETLENLICTSTHKHGHTHARTDRLEHVHTQAQIHSHMHTHARISAGTQMQANNC